MREFSISPCHGPGPWRFAAVLALGSAFLPVAAQTVQKCVAKDGHVILTSDECGMGERLAGRWDATPEPEPEAVPAARSAAARARASGTARPASHATTGRPRSKAGAKRCETARAKRERTLERVGLKRTFDLLRRLDDEVRAACR